MVNNTLKHNGELSASIVSGDYKPWSRNNRLQEYIYILILDTIFLFCIMTERI